MTIKKQFHKNLGVQNMMDLKPQGPRQFQPHVFCTHN